MGTARLPVAVIGGGPVGLSAMAHLLAADEEAVLLESGHQVGHGVSQWAHVRLFTRWEHNLDAVAASLLMEQGWTPPDSRAYPTGGDLVNRYLVPLAALPALSTRIRLGARVVSVTRAGFDKLRSSGRHQAPFLLRVVDTNGEHDIAARAVIDASGTWFTPNPLGAAGVRAIGEREASARIRYGTPDVLGVERERYAGRRVLVVGAGHSAFNVLTDLATLAEGEPETRIHWALRRSMPEGPLGRGKFDILPERARLAARVTGLLTAGGLRVHAGVHVDRLEPTHSGVEVWATGELVAKVDQIVASTGFRPDRSVLAELRLSLDPALESPSALAPLIDPNQHTCGTVPPHGAAELAHPDEPGIFIVGIKSYGRAPTALMTTAYEQVRSVVAAIGGNSDTARDRRPRPAATNACNV